MHALILASFLSATSFWQGEFGVWRRVGVGFALDTKKTGRYLISAPQSHRISALNLRKYDFLYVDAVAHK